MNKYIHIFHYLSFFLGIIMMIIGFSMVNRNDIAETLR